LFSKPEFIMRYLPVAVLAMAAGLFVAVPSFAQSNNGASATAKQPTDGNSPTVVGPGSGAAKQQTDGNSPTVIGPGSAAYKQQTDGNSPTVVGPGSGAFKNN
jgi:hypothetical protein